MPEDTTDEEYSTFMKRCGMIKEDDDGEHRAISCMLSYCNTLQASLIFTQSVSHSRPLLCRQTKAEVVQRLERCAKRRWAVLLPEGQSVMCYQSLSISISVCVIHLVSVSQFVSVGQYFSISVSRLVSQSVSRSVGGQSVSWWSVGQSVGHSLTHQ